MTERKRILPTPEEMLRWLDDPNAKDLDENGNPMEPEGRAELIVSFRSPSSDPGAAIYGANGEQVVWFLEFLTTMTEDSWESLFKAANRMFFLDHGMVDMATKSATARARAALDAELDRMGEWTERAYKGMLNGAGGVRAMRVCNAAAFVPGHPLLADGTTPLDAAISLLFGAGWSGVVALMLSPYATAPEFTMMWGGCEVLRPARDFRPDVD